MLTSLQRRIPLSVAISVAALAFLVAVAAVLTLSPAGQRMRLQAVTPGPSPTAPASPSPGAGSPPPWPAEATAGAVPQRSTIRGESCAHPPARPHVENVDPLQPFPSAAELARATPTIAVAIVRTQKGYWRQPPPGSPTFFTDLSATTATDYQVERVVKGHPGAWIQGIQAGADPAAIPCGGLVPAIVPDSLPVLGHEYVIFFDGAGATPPLITSGQRYEIRTGLVYSSGLAQFRVTGQTLDAFLASLGG
ncbi:MAG TPA: hypothetical protein VG245_11455 [Candidatus Dormibacteraeota bacterium]|nr:hypothetical protein [Candidatus Dormibacteraeota bacterium]